MVRPENVSVQRGVHSGPNCFAARIEAAVFQGSSFDLDLRLASDDVLTAQVPPPASDGDWAAGEEVTVEIAPANAVGVASNART